MQLILEITILTIFSIWFLASLINTSPFPIEKLVRFDTLLRFIPQWNFFAPQPGIYDYHLFYRDQLEGGTVGPWREVSDFIAPRSLLDAVWSPKSRSTKAVLDLIPALTREVERMPDYPNMVMLSIPYLLILNYVSKLSPSELSVARQFIILQSSRGENPEVIFVSGLHQLS